MVLLAVCAAVTVLLGAWFTGQTRAGWPDRGIDARLQASLGGHREMLNLLAGLGDPVPVTVMTAALLAACLVVRRWRGAALAAVAVPAAGAITEFLLKPLVDRTLQGQLSFPSGHSTGMFALAAVLAVLLADPVRLRMPAALRLALALAGAAVAGAVAISLVALGAHYLTDAVAGAAVGTGVALATALILDRLGRHLTSGAVTASGRTRLRELRDTVRERGAGDRYQQQDDGADHDQEKFPQCLVPAPARRR